MDILLIAILRVVAKKQVFFAEVLDVSLILIICNFFIFTVIFHVKYLLQKDPSSEFRFCLYRMRAFYSQGICAVLVNVLLALIREINLVRKTSLYVMAPCFRVFC